MTQARTWSEELVAQYFEIQGYRVERNVGYGTGASGGRMDADVVAYKVGKAKMPIIIDVEVGTYYQSAETVRSWLGDKYTSKREKYIRRLVSRMLSPNSSSKAKTAKYSKLFINVDDTMRKRVKMQKLLSKIGVEYKELWEVFLDIPSKVKKWGKSHKSEKGTPATLPEGYNYVKIVYECSNAIDWHKEG